MVSQFWDAVAVGSDYELYVFFTHKKRAPLCVKLPEVSLLETFVWLGRLTEPTHHRTTKR